MDQAGFTEFIPPRAGPRTLRWLTSLDSLGHMCIFCEIVEGGAPATTRWSNDQWIAIDDIHPKAKTHVLLVSRKHIPSLDATNEEDDALLASVLPTIRRLAREWSLVESGYRVVNNCGVGAGQLVDHLHFHLMSGKLTM